MIAQAAETGGWDAAEWIALTAVLATVVTVIVNAWLNNRRLVSEERRHAESLANVRRVAHEANAAKAYLAAEHVERWINWVEVGKAVDRGQERLSPEHKAVVMAAVDAITEAKAYAWTDEMVTAAGGVIVALVNLENTAYASIGRLQTTVGDGEQEKREWLKMRERLEKQFDVVSDAYHTAIEEYRKAMNG